jgi:hypothetical protein
MTTLTMRHIRGEFLVTGPDITPMKFKSRFAFHDGRYPAHGFAATRDAAMEAFTRRAERVGLPDRLILADPEEPRRVASNPGASLPSPK